MRSLTSLPDSNWSDAHGQSGVLNLFCPDCGLECNHTGTNEFRNQFCYQCPEPLHKRHWYRYAGHIEYVKVAECEICRKEPT